MKIALEVLLIMPFWALAVDLVDLGHAGNFAILAGSGISSTGGGTVDGDLGLSPTTGAAITGLTAGQVIGVIYTVDSAGPVGSVEGASRLSSAKNDLSSAYNDAAGRPVDATVATELGGTTRLSGVYDSASGTFGITGTLTLDGNGDPNAFFIFKMATTLITAADSQVILINGASPGNVFWQVGSSATLGAFTDFKGIIMADQSITLSSGSTIDGRALAVVATVTFDGLSVKRSAPTLAMITAVRSRVEDGVAVISWDVELELDTVGYHLERWRSGAWQRVNAALIPAQYFEQGTKTYEQADPVVGVGTVQRYHIVELDNRGRLIPYGPYELVLDGGESSYSTWAAEVHWAAADFAVDADPDGDGRTNFQEYLARTDPLNANSVLRVGRGESVVGGILLTWDGVPGRIYTVEMTPSLLQPFVAIAVGIYADAVETSYLVPVDASTLKNAFYRIIVGND